MKIQDPNRDKIFLRLNVMWWRTFPKNFSFPTSEYKVLKLRINFRSLSRPFEICFGWPRSSALRCDKLFALVSLLLLLALTLTVSYCCEGLDRKFDFRWFSWRWNFASKVSQPVCSLSIDFEFSTIVVTLFVLFGRSSWGFNLWSVGCFLNTRI